MSNVTVGRFDEGLIEGLRGDAVRVKGYRKKEKRVWGRASGK